MERQNAYIEIRADVSLSDALLATLGFTLDRRRGGLMTGLNAEKTEKTDETDRINEANRIDETDRIGEIEKIDEIERTDEIERIDKTDRPDLAGIRSRSALRFSNLWVRARAPFRFFGFDDPASVSGVLGFCFHGDSVAFCYLSHHRRRVAYRRP